jgi:hypothetical protein
MKQQEENSNGCVKMKLKKVLENIGLGNAMI